MDIHPEDETSYTTQYQLASLKYVHNEYCANHRCLPVTKPEYILKNNLVSSAMASRSGQSSSDPYDLSSYDKEYLMPNNLAKTTPGQSDGAACIFTAARHYLNSPPELRPNWGQTNPNHNDYHFDPMEISSTIWSLDITDWWRQEEETHPK